MGYEKIKTFQIRAPSFKCMTSTLMLAQLAINISPQLEAEAQTNALCASIFAIHVSTHFITDHRRLNI